MLAVRLRSSTGSTTQNVFLGIRPISKLIVGAMKYFELLRTKMEYKHQVVIVSLIILFFCCWKWDVFEMGFRWAPQKMLKSWVGKIGMQTSQLGLPCPELLMFPCDGGSVTYWVADNMAAGYWGTACFCQEDMDTRSLLSNNVNTSWGHSLGIH